MAKRKRKVEETTAVELPPRCPRQNCRSTGRSRKEGVVKKQLRGRTRDGESFNEVHYSYVNCTECGHRYQVRSFHLITRNANSSSAAPAT